MYLGSFSPDSGTLGCDCLESALDGLYRASGSALFTTQKVQASILLQDGFGCTTRMARYVLLNISGIKHVHLLAIGLEERNEVVLHAKIPADNFEGITDM